MIQKTIVSFILLALIVLGVGYGTNHMGLSVVVTRDYASPRATQTLGTLEVFNWWGHKVYTAKTIEVPRNRNLLHLGKFELFLNKAYMRTGKPAENVYGIFDSSHFLFGNISKNQLYTIRMANSIHDVDGSIGLGESITVLSHGAIWMNNTGPAYDEFMSVMHDTKSSTLLIRSYNDTIPKWEIQLPGFHPVLWSWKLIKWIL